MDKLKSYVVKRYFEGGPTSEKELAIRIIVAEFVYSLNTTLSLAKCNAVKTSKVAKASRK